MNQFPDALAYFGPDVGSRRDDRINEIYSEIDEKQEMIASYEADVADLEEELQELENGR